MNSEAAPAAEPTVTEVCKQFVQFYCPTETGEKSIINPTPNMQLALKHLVETCEMKQAYRKMQVNSDMGYRGNTNPDHDVWISTLVAIHTMTVLKFKLEHPGIKAAQLSGQILVYGDALPLPNEVTVLMESERQSKQTTERVFLLLKRAKLELPELQFWLQLDPARTKPWSSILIKSNWTDELPLVKINFYPVSYRHMLPGFASEMVFIGNVNENIPDIADLLTENALRFARVIWLAQTDWLKRKTMDIRCYHPDVIGMRRNAEDETATVGEITTTN